MGQGIAEKEPGMQALQSWGTSGTWATPSGREESMAGWSGRLSQRVLGTVAKLKRNIQMWWGGGSV